MDSPSPISLEPDPRPAPLARAFDPGPILLAVPFRRASSGRARPLLSLEEGAGLAGISNLVSFKKGVQLYREGDAAAFVHVIASGYAKTWRALPNGTIQVTSFRTAGDLLGLAAEGRHVDAARAITAVRAYRVSLEALATLLQTDGTLSLRLLCKLADTLVAQQRHAVMLGRGDALGKLAMFLQMLEQFQRERGLGGDIIYLPMSRLDIGDYLGLSEAVVSRTFTALSAEGVVSFRTKRQLRVTDRARLLDLIGSRRAGRTDAAKVGE